MMAEIYCFICGELTRPRQRFVFHPASDNNEKHRNFYTTFVDPSYSFDLLAANSSLFVCRKGSSCYSKLDAGVAKAEALSRIIKNIKDLLPHTERGDNPGEGSSPGAATGTSCSLGKRTPVQRAPQPAARKRLRMSTSTAKAHDSFVRTPSSVVKVTHFKGRRVRKFVVKSPFKTVVKSLRYKDVLYTARSVLKVPALSQATLSEVIKTIKLECVSLCKKKLKVSAFRVTTAEQLLTFRWDSLLNELSTRAPTLLAILNAAADKPHRTRRKCDSSIEATMAAAILLKKRNRQMGLLQTIVASILHHGHAAKKVYSRLHKLGVCISHKTATKINKKLGENHDAKVLEWMDQTVDISPEVEFTLHTRTDEVAVQKIADPCYVIQGDNIDKTVRARDMRVDNQNQSIHYFNSFAVRDRIPLVENPVESNHQKINSAPLSTFLPTAEDCSAMRDGYITLISRVLVENLAFLAPFKQCVPQHIVHAYSQEMSKKSEMVPLGVIPKNENKKEEMTEILEELHRYVPEDGNKLLKVAFGGDQLTAERARNVQLIRVNSEDSKSALAGLLPYTSDWHAEVILLQIMFDHLYKTSSNCDGGTLLQLRNLINRRNIAKDVTGRFNETIDFAELVINCHIVAAGMKFFGLKSMSDEPAYNSSILRAKNEPKEKQWKQMKVVVGRLVDRFVIVERFMDIQPKAPIPRELSTRDVFENPHALRIQSEHGYCMQHATRVTSEHCYVQAPTPPPKKKRKLPSWIQSTADHPHAAESIHSSAPDGVFDYACAVLNDGLLLLEFRDAIHEGDGIRNMRCWKFLMLYYRHFHHYKYALEGFYTLAQVHVLASQRLKNQIMYSRVVNTRGGCGNNLPVDLQMEHFNRILKDAIIGVGANVTETVIVEASKYINGIHTICVNFDSATNIKPESMHHTRKSSAQDMGLILKQLTTESNVFSYIPGRYHKSTPHVEPNVTRTVDAGALFKWLTQHQKDLANKIEFENLFKK